MFKHLFSFVGVVLLSALMVGVSASAWGADYKGEYKRPPNPETDPKATLVLAVEPQHKDAKAYGDLGTLIGGVLTRDLALALKGQGKQSYLSPLQATEAYRIGNKLDERARFLSKMNNKANFGITDMKGLNSALCKTYKELCASSSLAFTGVDRVLVVRADLDFTRPYRPPSRWKRIMSWFEGNLNEEAMGYVDVDIQRFDRSSTGIYQVVHQWQGEFRLPTDRMVGATLSVYDEPSANTWVSRLGHEVFQEYWKATAIDYGVVRNLNPLNKLPIPPKEAWDLDESKFESYRK
jgi:hypothetical protein